MAREHGLGAGALFGDCRVLRITGEQGELRGVLDRGELELLRPGSLEGHLLGFAAERARGEGRVVDFAAYRREIAAAGNA